jgi:tetratricopeptide (TPR) repeat protein
MPAGWLPDMTVTGTAAAHLDVRRGEWRRIEWTLGVELAGRDFSGRMEVASVSALTGTRALPKTAAAEWRERARAFDAVVADLYRPGGVTQAIARLGELKELETDEAWHDGLALTLAMIDPAHHAPTLIGLEAQGEARDANPARVAIEAADLALLGGRWQEAAAAYVAVADRYPDDEIAAEALTAAAALHERRLADPAAAAALHRRAAAWRQGRAAAGGADAYKLAGTLARAGEIEKAAQAYERFCANPDADSPGWMRLLAQCRAAELREKLGQREEALAGFKAALAAAGEDDYSTRLKDKTRRRMAALEGRP